MAESKWPSKFYQAFFCLPSSIIPLFTIAFLTRFTLTNDSYKKRSVGRPRKTRQSDLLPISSSIPASITDDQPTEKSSSREETNSLDDNSSSSSQANELKQPDAQIGQIAE